MLVQHVGAAGLLHSSKQERLLLLLALGICWYRRGAGAGAGAGTSAGASLKAKAGC
jgi:hypothetical protein